MGELAVDREAPTTEIVEGALRDIKELVQVEIALAKDELKREALAAKRSLVAFVIALVLMPTGIALLVLGLVTALSVSPLLTGGLGSVLLLAAGCAVWLGAKSFPS